LRWLLAGGLAVVAVVATAQTGGGSPDNPFVRIVTDIYEHLAFAWEAHHATALAANIRHSDQKVYVDGAPAPPLQFRRSIGFILQVPGDDSYQVTFWSRGLRGWTEAGRIHGSTIEFQAGPHHVVVQCNVPLGGDDTPVMVRRGE
jgi:hypothetical protein